MALRRPAPVSPLHARQGKRPRWPGLLAVGSIVLLWLYLRTLTDGAPGSSGGALPVTAAAAAAAAAAARNGASNGIVIGSSSAGSESELAGQQQAAVLSADQQRSKVVAFVGVMTGFTTNKNNPKYDYVARRAALRETWFPADAAAAAELEGSGVAVRFVVGHSSDAGDEAAMDEEAARHGCFLRLPIQEHYGGLPFKVVTFLRAALQGWDFEYLFKVDDDVYLRTDRVLPAVQQWRSAHVDYTGCMKQGAVFRDASQRWFEPQHALLGDQYFTHTWGSAYVLSAAAVRAVTAVPPGLLRFFSNEDVTIGSWMLAMNVTHYDDRRMCEKDCSKSSVVVYDYPECAGLCRPAQRLRELHDSDACHLPAVPSDTGRLPARPRAFRFAKVPQLASTTASSTAAAE